MTVSDIKKAIKDLPDNAEVLIVGYDRKTGKTTQQYTHQCCNFEHQASINQLWLSNEGLYLHEEDIA